MTKAYKELEIQSGKATSFHCSRCVRRWHRRRRCLAALTLVSTLVQVLPAVRGVMRPRAKLVVLIKPQFEALRGEVRRVHASAPSSAELASTQVGSGGVVRDPAVHASVLKRVVSGIEAMGFACQGTTPSPLRGAKEGNIEFLASFDFINADLALPPPGADDADADDAAQEQQGLAAEKP